eukprot:366020-Chlamydomonas_euryale.AAC.3
MPYVCIRLRCLCVCLGREVHVHGPAHPSRDDVQLAVHRSCKACACQRWTSPKSRTRGRLGRFQPLNPKSWIAPRCRLVHLGVTAACGAPGGDCRLRCTWGGRPQRDWSARLRTCAQTCTKANATFALHLAKKTTGTRAAPAAAHPFLPPAVWPSSYRPQCGPAFHPCLPPQPLDHLCPAALQAVPSCASGGRRLAAPDALLAAPSCASGSAQLCFRQRPAVLRAAPSCASGSTAVEPQSLFPRRLQLDEARHLQRALSVATAAASVPGLPGGAILSFPRPPAPCSINTASTLFHAPPALFNVGVPGGVNIWQHGEGEALLLARLHRHSSPPPAPLPSRLADHGPTQNAPFAAPTASLPGGVLLGVVGAAAVEELLAAARRLHVLHAYVQALLHHAVANLRARHGTANRRMSTGPVSPQHLKGKGRGKGEGGYVDLQALVHHAVCQSACRTEHSSQQQKPGRCDSRAAAILLEGCSREGDQHAC